MPLKHNVSKVRSRLIRLADGGVGDLEYQLWLKPNSKGITKTKDVLESIAHENARLGRDPFFLSSQQVGLLVQYIKQYIAQGIARMKFVAERTFSKNMRSIIRDEIKKNIKQGNYYGSPKDLTDKYKQEKNRNWGFVYPMLYASGNFLESIDVRKKRKKK